MNARRARMLHALALALALAAAAASVQLARAEPLTYVLDPMRTQVWWEVRHFGTSTQRGRFDDVGGRIELDRAAHAGHVSMRVRTASVSSGVPALDRMLRSDRFLAADAHPDAYFVAARFAFEGERLVAVRGEFTLRGVSQPLELRAARFACRRDAARSRETCGGDFEGELRRSDFGSTFGVPFVGDVVRLLIAVEAVSP